MCHEKPQNGEADCATGGTILIAPANGLGPMGWGGLYGSKWQLNVGAPFLLRKGRFCLRHWSMVDGWTGP